MGTKIEIYTDGACSTNGTWDGGWGVVVVINGELYRKEGGFAEKTTNNIMEMTAVIKAIDILHSLQSNLPLPETIIYTDSAYIVNCFEQKWHESWVKNGWLTAKKEPVKNKLLWVDILGYLLPNHRWVRLEKVKGHDGNEYNEMADQIAVICKMNRTALGEQQ